MVYQQKKEAILKHKEITELFGLIFLLLGYILSYVDIKIALPIYVLSTATLIKMQYWDIVMRMKGFDKKK